MVRSQRSFDSLLPVCKGCFSLLLTSKSIIFGYQQFDYDGSTVVFCVFVMLGFAKILDSGHLFLSPDLGNFWPLFYHLHSAKSAQ